MTAVLLALASAAFFGGMTVAIRTGLGGGNASAAALATVLPALVIALASSLVRHDYTGAWRFALAGLLAPGASQLLFTMSVREVGASRTSVMVGVAPLAALTLAFVFLGEPVQVPLIVGGLAIVAGGVALASESDRPKQFRRRGLVFAAMAATLFAVRDNIVRALHAHGSPETAAAGALLVGALLLVVYTRRLPTGGELRRLFPAGVLFGLSYVCLFEAYFHGRVSVVSPLVATESFWGVGLAALFLGETEGIGRRVVGGAALVVAGGMVIGVFR